MNPVRNAQQPSGDDKTMLVLCMADRVGALHDVLQAFQVEKQ